MPISTLSFSSFVKATFSHATEQNLRKQKASKPVHAWSSWRKGDARIDPATLSNSVNTTAKAGHHDGWAVLRNIYDTFDYLDQREGFKRTVMQRRAHEFFIEATLRIIFGKSFAANVGRLKRRFSLRRLRQEALVSAPRRFGKTYGTAMFTSVFNYCVPYSTIGVYSTGRRASQSFLTTQYKITCVLPNGPGEVECE